LVLCPQFTIATSDSVHPSSSALPDFFAPPANSLGLAAINLHHSLDESEVSSITASGLAATRRQPRSDHKLIALHHLQH